MAPSRELNRAIRESIRRIREAALYDRARLGAGARIDGPAIITELFSAATGLLGPPKHLYRFAEADDHLDDTAAPTVDRPHPDRSLEPTFIWRLR